MTSSTRTSRRAAEAVPDPGGLAMELLSQLARRASFEFAAALAPLGLPAGRLPAHDLPLRHGRAAPPDRDRPFGRGRATHHGGDPAPDGTGQPDRPGGGPVRRPAELRVADH